MTLGSTSGWSQNIPSPTCAALTYTLVNQADSTTADSIFSISGTSIKVNTNSYLKVGTYNLNLIGSIGIFTSSSVSFTVNVQNPCSTVTKSTTSVSDITAYYTTTTA
jgi:hypothetical protein